MSVRTHWGFSGCFVGVSCDTCDYLVVSCCDMCVCWTVGWDVWLFAWCVLWHVWLFGWCLLWHAWVLAWFLLRCVCVCVFAWSVLWRVNFGLVFAECCLEPLFLNSSKALHLGQYQVFGIVLIFKQNKWNSWIAQLGLQHLTVSSSVPVCSGTLRQPMEPHSLLDSLFSCTIEQVPQAKHKFSKIFAIWVQLYSSGLCLEEFFVTIA